MNASKTTHNVAGQPAVGTSEIPTGEAAGSSRLRSLPSIRWTSLLAIAVLLLTLWGTTVIRTRLLAVPLERDEGEFALAGSLILDGSPPYERLYNMKWPGTYYSYALIEAAFGRNIEGIRFGILLVNLASIVLVFVIARRLLDAWAASAAALAYATLSVSPSSLAIAGHATHFVVLSALVAIFFLQKALASRRLWLYVVAGFFGGLAPVMKQPGLAFTGFVLAYWLYEELRAREGWRGAVRRGTALLVGTILPLAIMLGRTSLPRSGCGPSLTRGITVVRMGRRTLSDSSCWG
jgi:4-amino-4-deoxy-L-arabinose transferase-like glycosyltransferase